MARQAVNTFDDYVDVLRRSGLVEKGQLDQVINEFARMSTTGRTDCQNLARRLIDLRLITPWQHSHLQDGRSKGFFLGKYKLLSLLGTGGMSTVYLAEHVMMKRRVALKVLMEAQVDRTTLERFRRECRAVASLDHRNIVRAHDFDSDGKFHYMVMEYVKGGDLQNHVDKHGTLAIRKAADYLRQAAEGLAHAHAAGLIHRDIKPANLLLGPREMVKVLDMGVAKITHLEHTKLTVDSQQNLLGTVDFLAPEQALNSHEVDARADVYSLGCTLYFFLTGQPPFAEGTQAQRLLAHQISPVPDILVKRPDCPPELAAICMKMLSKKPEHRYPAMAAVSHVLSQFLNNWKEPEPVPPSAPTVAEPAAEREHTVDTATTETRANAERRTIQVRQVMIKVNCPGCTSTFGAPAQAANRKVKCPHCGTTILIPPPPATPQS